jgi:hypothetical protein
LNKTCNGLAGRRLARRRWSGGFDGTDGIHSPTEEHRWRSTRGTIMDLLPAGPKLREAKQITWPESPFTMSLVGFEHVFTNARPVEFAPDLMLKVIRLRP